MPRKRVIIRGRARVLYFDRRGRIKRNISWRNYMKGKRSVRKGKVHKAQRRLLKRAFHLQFPLLGK